MTNIPLSFGDAAHLTRFVVAAPKPAFSGAWTTLELQPDIFVPQRFSIGVVVQSPGERLHFKLLDDFKKFDCLYRDAFPQKSLRELLAYAESTLRRAVQDKRAIPEVAFETDCFYEDFSVKRRASRRYLTRAADRKGEQVRSKVGDSQGLEVLFERASIRAGRRRPTPHAACAPGALAIPGHQRAPSFGTVTSE